MNVRQLCDVSLKTGELLISNGGEVYRVEETINRIFNASGRTCDTFVLLSGIFISTTDEKGHEITVVRRIGGHSFDLRKIEKVNALSRSIASKPISYVEALKKIDEIKSPERYSKLNMTVAAGLTSLVYVLLYKGTIWEALAALIFRSLLAYPVKELVGKVFSFQFLEYFSGGFITGFLAVLYTFFFPSLGLYRIVIGGIMIMVPGIAITTGLKDALYGDVVSSIYRLADGIFISVAVGVGIAFSIAIGGKLL
jgi:Uncharacterized conserved protein